MGFNSNAIAVLNRTIELAGTQINIEYFSSTPGSVWDDEATYAKTGSLWTSGIVLPVRGTEGSDESVLVSQGKLTTSDKMLYVNGSLSFTGSSSNVTVQLGSPTGGLYTTIPQGGIVYEAEGIPVYKKQYIRLLTTGSFLK